MQALTCVLVALLVVTWPTPAVLALEIGFDELSNGVGPLGSPPDAREEALLGGLEVDASRTHPSLAYLSVPRAWHDLDPVAFTGLPSGPGVKALDYDYDGGVWEGPSSVAEPGTLALALLTALGGGGAVAVTRHRGRDVSRRR